ncbi:MAG: LLM class flavin-dependent oxidoreductase [Acidimicrobiales bacterium]|nr:LLM class flavin-dependent oxidoreductase [Acidimicrobiales bacterium]MDP6299001.1 LLM class flavin-dependent oxidoreductase [Acidimicrobiales bacterium]HJM27503.1 LLM class flavin-dependent oxidoreductase [Acidimicrobiales bacterium]HJM98341.1 LLM class flavin-dependent oxidoreductase [Acidimicrobiales bacterium]
MFTLRFDFRLKPDSPTTMQDLYDTALDMCEWGERNGAMTAMFSEHHTSPDGYLPSPLILAAAAAARTDTLTFNVGALLLLMYDPIKLAEDISVLDHLSGGRIGYTIGLGYRDEEYEMFGVDKAKRGQEIEERILTLRRALAGEQFKWRGRHIHVHPKPLTSGGPIIAYGGGSKAAAERAARLGIMFFPQTTNPTMSDLYDAEATRVGNPTGMTMGPEEGAPTTIFVAEDLDKAWQQYGQYMLHDATEYRKWMGEQNNSASLSHATTITELREEKGPYRIVTPEEAVSLISQYQRLSLQPLCGGIPPEIAWESLNLIEEKVFPLIP